MCDRERFKYNGECDIKERERDRKRKKQIQREAERTERGKSARTERWKER